MKLWAGDQGRQKSCCEQFSVATFVEKQKQEHQELQQLKVN